MTKLKVRTGCSVCKTRRVKCDETKPFCIKCTSTGRMCGGYPPPLPRKVGTRRSKYDVLQTSQAQNVVVTSVKPDSTLALSDSASAYVLRIPQSLSRARSGLGRDESRSLEYYRLRVSVDISGYFDIYFWNNLVLQMSEEEPVVRHAVLALSALYEAGETSQPPQYAATNDRYDRCMRFAVHEYTKAVRMLLNRTSIDGPHLEVTLMTCLVFTWVEFLRDNTKDALRHLQSGLCILTEQRQLAGSLSVVKQVAHILGRVLIQATLHGSSTVDFDYHAIMGYISGSEPLKFAVLGDARFDIDGKINSILCFLRRIKDAADTELHRRHGPLPDLLSLRRTHQDHMRGLDQWKAAFGVMRDGLDINAMTADELQALLQVELCYLLISNTLETLFATTPMLFDKYNDTYARMVYLCRRMLQNRILRRVTAHFTFPFDNSIQGALFYTVFRCRYLPIRREAVQLLQLCPDHEGIWRRASLVALCNWKIDIEEIGRPPSALETDPLPESARVSSERAREASGGGCSTMAIRFKRGASGGTSGEMRDEEEITTLSMRLAGLLETWRTVTLYDIAETRVKSDA